MIFYIPSANLPAAVHTFLNTLYIVVTQALEDTVSVSISYARRKKSSVIVNSLSEIGGFLSHE